jgi:hypothetical protein
VFGFFVVKFKIEYASIFSNPKGLIIPNSKRLGKRNQYSISLFPEISPLISGMSVWVGSLLWVIT